MPWEPCSTAVYGAVRTFPQTWFFEAGPGRNPPWYFIGQAAIEGVWAMVGFILLSLFTAIGAGRLGPTVWAAFAVSGVSFLSRIGPGIDVWFKTSRLWKEASARA